MKTFIKKIEKIKNRFHGRLRVEMWVVSGNDMLRNSPGKGGEHPE